MIDTSDGIADAARRLAHASGVRVVVNVDDIPWDARLAGIASIDERLRWALYGGDYELLAAIPRPRTSRAVRSIPPGGAGITIVGSVHRGGERS